MPPVDFFEIFQFFVLAHSAHLWQFVLTYSHIIRRLLNVIEDILYYTLSPYKHRFIAGFSIHSTHQIAYTH